MSESSDGPSRIAAWVTAGALAVVVVAVSAIAVSVARQPRNDRPLAASATGAPASKAPPSKAPASAGSSGVSAVPAPDVVPWLDQPATPPPLSPPPTPTPPAPAYPPCTASQLKTAPGVSQGAAGNDISVVALTNASASNCSLFGYPTSFIAVRADGSRQRLAPSHTGMFSAFYTWPANLRPGDVGHVGIMFTMACDAAQRSGANTLTTFKSVVLGLPGGGTVSAPAQFASTCGIGVTEFGAPPPPPPEIEPYPGLTAAMNAPRTVVAGSTLDYTVTLTNTSAHDIKLDPCPVYEEGIYPPTPDVAQPHDYRLNCQAVPVIPAQGSVTFAMRVAVPAKPAQLAKFSWVIPGAGVGAGAAVTIVAS